MVRAAVVPIDTHRDHLQHLRLWLSRPLLRRDQDGSDRLATGCCVQVGRNALLLDPHLWRDRGRGTHDRDWLVPVSSCSTSAKVTELEKGEYSIYVYGINLF